MGEIAERMIADPDFPAAWAMWAVKWLGEQMTDDFRTYFWRKIKASG